MLACLVAWGRSLGVCLTGWLMLSGAGVLLWVGSPEGLLPCPAPLELALVHVSGHMPKKSRVKGKATWGAFFCLAPPWGVAWPAGGVNADLLPW